MWLLHSVDHVQSNGKRRPTFWDQISFIYNFTTEPPYHRTPKQLKDWWSTSNRKITLFNDIYN
jgi:hypothetical protein